MNLTYIMLMQDGWKMNDIDGMDMIGYLRLRSWHAGYEKKKTEPKKKYIDQIWSTGN